MTSSSSDMIQFSAGKATPTQSEGGFGGRRSSVYSHGKGVIENKHTTEVSTCLT